MSEQEWAIHSVQVGWLIDTCASGAWSWDVSQAITLPTMFDAVTLIRGFAKDNGEPSSSLLAIRIK